MDNQQRSSKENVQRLSRKGVALSNEVEKVDTNIYKIYLLKDPVTQEIRYVGQTYKILKYRLNEHLQDSKRKKFRNVNWIKSLLKKDLKPIIELIEECSLDNVDEREIYWISYFRSINSKLNNHDDGGRFQKRKFKHSEEFKSKIGKFMKNFKKSKEHVRKIAINFMFPVSQYTIEGQFINSYESIREASKQTGINRKGIALVCKNLQKKAGKYVWKYSKDIV